MRDQGRLHVLEGPDGVGKTTLCAALADHLRARGRVVHLLASPGRTPRTLGRLVWRLHHSPAEFEVSTVHPVSLQLLHVAAHIDALEGVIRPALDAGEDVVLDRFWWSTIVYGMRAGVASSALEGMIALEDQYWEAIAPHRIFLILRERPFRAEVPQCEFELLTQAYMDLAEKAPNVTIVNNAGSIESALDAIKGALTSEAAWGCCSPEAEAS